MKHRRAAVSPLIPLAAASVAVFAAVALSRRRDRGLQLFRSVTVAAPAEAVYDFWTRFESFPECFTPIKEVRRTGNDNEWRWKMPGPDGADVEWDTWVTESIPGKAIAWESAPGANMKSAGVVQFTDAGRHSTRVDVRMSYRPSGRRTKRALKTAFGTNPDRTLDQCLARLQAKFDEDLPASDDSI